MNKNKIKIMLDSNKYIYVLYAIVIAAVNIGIHFYFKTIGVPTEGFNHLIIIICANTISLIFSYAIFESYRKITNALNKISELEREIEKINSSISSNFVHDNELLDK